MRSDASGWRAGSVAVKRSWCMVVSLFLGRGQKPETHHQACATNARHANINDHGLGLRCIRVNVASTRRIAALTERRTACVDPIGSGH
jgi:hypothetical protein